MKDWETRSEESSRAPIGQLFKLADNDYHFNLSHDAEGEAVDFLYIAKERGVWIGRDGGSGEIATFGKTLKECVGDCFEYLQTFDGDEGGDEEEELTVLDAPYSEFSHDERVSEAVAAQYESGFTLETYDDDSPVTVWIDSAAALPRVTGLYSALDGIERRVVNRHYVRALDAWFTDSDNPEWVSCPDFWGYETVVGQIASIPPSNN